MLFFYSTFCYALASPLRTSERTGEGHMHTYTNAPAHTHIDKTLTPAHTHICKHTLLLTHT